MRTKMFALAVAAMGLFAGGTVLAFNLTGKAQADTPVVATEAQVVDAAGCCVTGDCCCPGQGACCDPAVKVKANTTTAVKKGDGCCVTGNCCCPGQGSCCADLTTVKADAKVGGTNKGEKKGSCCKQ